MHQFGYRPLRKARRESGESSRVTWSKLGLLVIDKLLLVVVTAAAITFFQDRLRLSEERFEKARHISEIVVDRPVSIVAELPAHLDAFILYAEHIRAGDFKISSERLTELQGTINSDIEGSRVYYSNDKDIKLWATSIKKTIVDVRAKALSTNGLEIEDIDKLEEARELAYRFHRRIIDLSVQQALEQFDTAYERHRLL